MTVFDNNFSVAGTILAIIG